MSNENKTTSYGAIGRRFQGAFMVGLVTGLLLGAGIATLMMRFPA